MEDKRKETTQMSKKERLKIVAKDYGKTVIVFHVGISLISLGMFYTLVSRSVDVYFAGSILIECSVDV